MSAPGDRPADLVLEGGLRRHAFSVDRGLLQDVRRTLFSNPIGG